MSSKTEFKKNLKKEKVKFHKEISSLRKTLSDYKLERKANWKSFKNKMNDDIRKIEKPVDKLTSHNKK